MGCEKRVVHDRPRQVEALIAGTQKGGTTALFSFLQQHPQIGTPQTVKELHFFDCEAAFAGEQVDYGPYHAHFAHAAASKVWLEATPIYMYWREALERIAAYNPAMKFVLILRHPVERAISHWEMQWSRGLEGEAFAAAVERELKLLAGRPTEQERERSYVDRGFYGRQLARLYKHFPREQFLLLRREDLLLNHAATLRSVCHFLQLSDFATIPAAKMVYPTLKHVRLGPLPAGLRESLLALYRNDLQLLSGLSGLDVSGWLEH